jgi:hypothetical protein
VSWEVVLSLGIPATVAVVGYFLTYRNNLRLSRRKDRLDRVTRQLSDFYGPLFATASASDASWHTFREQVRPGGAFWDRPGPPPTPEEQAAWRLWMTTVFMPLNRQMRDVIVDHADLLDEERIPELLLEVCAHVAAYEAVLRRWEESDYSEHITSINFPADELLWYAREGVRRLKAEQNRLLNVTASPEDSLVRDSQG